MHTVFRELVGFRGNIFAAFLLWTLLEFDKNDSSFSAFVTTLMLLFGFNALVSALS